MPQACKPGKQVHLKQSQKKKHAAKTRMPMCQYGAGCTRKDCVYRHDTRGSEVRKTQKICMPFVCGLCEFGKGCHNRHPNAAEVATIRAKYSGTRCAYGSSCRTQGCLFHHPWDAPGAAATAPRSGAETRVAPDGGRFTQQEFEEYFGGTTEWDAAAGTSEGGAGDTGGAGMTSPAPAAATETATAAATAAATATATAMAALVAAEPAKPAMPATATKTTRAPAVQPSAGWHLEQTQKAGMWGMPEQTNLTQVSPFSSTAGFTSPSTQIPSLHSLTMEPGKQGWAAQSQQQQQTQTQSWQQPPQAPSPASLQPWAAAAARQPDASALEQQQQQTVTPRQAGGATKRAVLFPSELWVSDAERDAAACFGIADPIKRFREVNTVNKSPDVMDMHYQSTVTARTVLDALLWPMLQQHGAVWLVTGTGHHVAAGHQKRGATLFAFVGAYLTEYEYDFVEAKDSQGRSGSYRVVLR